MTSGDITYPTGDQSLRTNYQGQTTNLSPPFPEGEGTMRYINGSVYTGSFYQGAIHGKGRILMADGSSYVGDWVAGTMQGRGEFVFGKSQFMNVTTSLPPQVWPSCHVCRMRCF
jgi:hypothetical protein